MKRLIQVCAFAIIVVGAAAERAQAGLTVTLGDVTLAPGATGTMDISISSDSGDMLTAFGVELLITPAGGTTSLLEFTSAQPGPSGNLDYVFSAGSFNSDNSLPFWGLPFLTNFTNDTIIGGDSSTAGPVAIPLTAGGPNSFLASVQFQAPPGATLGDHFQISLVGDPNFTYFDDENGDPLDYANTGGAVAIATVPEPSSLALAAISGLGVLINYWRSGARGRSPRPALPRQYMP